MGLTTGARLDGPFRSGIKYCQWQRFTYFKTITFFDNTGDGLSREPQTRPAPLIVDPGGLLTFGYQEKVC